MQSSLECITKKVLKIVSSGWSLHQWPYVTFRPMNGIPVPMQGKKKWSFHSRMLPFCCPASPLISIKIYFCLPDGPPKNEQAPGQPTCKWLDPPLHYSCPNYKQKTYTCSRILNTWKSNNKLAFLKKQNNVIGLGQRQKNVAESFFNKRRTGFNW